MDEGEIVSTIVNYFSVKLICCSLRFLSFSSFHNILLHCGPIIWNEYSHICKSLGLVSGRSVYELCHENQQVLGWANVSIAPGGGGGQPDWAWADCRCMEIRLAGDWRAEKDGRGVMRNLERCCILFSFINPTTQSTYRQTPMFHFVSMMTSHGVDLDFLPDTL